VGVGGGGGGEGVMVFFHLFHFFLFISSWVSIFGSVCALFSAGANSLFTKPREFAPDYDYGASFGVFGTGGCSGVGGGGYVQLVDCEVLAPINQ